MKLSYFDTKHNTKTYLKQEDIKMKINPLERSSHHNGVTASNTGINVHLMTSTVVVFDGISSI